LAHRSVWSRRESIQCHDAARGRNVVRESYRPARSPLPHERETLCKRDSTGSSISSSYSSAKLFVLSHFLTAVGTAIMSSTPPYVVCTRICRPYFHQTHIMIISIPLILVFITDTCMYTRQYFRLATDRRTYSSISSLLTTTK